MQQYPLIQQPTTNTLQSVIHHSPLSPPLFFPPLLTSFSSGQYRNGLTHTTGGQDTTVDATRTTVTPGLPVSKCDLCPAGRYGNTPGLTSSDCSGLCEAGYYCPYGSTSSRQYPCGGADVYCPEGSAGPIAAGGGRYTVVYVSATATPTALPSGGTLVHAGE